MKKNLTILLLVLLFLVSCGKSHDLHVIKSVDAMAKMDNKESFVLVLGQASCGACQAYKPTVKEAVNDKSLDIYYVEMDTELIKNGDISQPDEEGRANITKFLGEYLQDKVRVTPTTLLIQEGKVGPIVEGNIKKEMLVEWLQINEVLK